MRSRKKPPLQANTFLPSRGPTGSMLKEASMPFTFQPMAPMIEKKPPPRKARVMNGMARRRFVIAPEAEYPPVLSPGEVRPVDHRRPGGGKDKTDESRHRHRHEEHQVVLLELGPVTVVHRGELVGQFMEDETDPDRHRGYGEDEDEILNGGDTPDKDQGEGQGDGEPGDAKIAPFPGGEPFHICYRIDLFTDTLFSQDALLSEALPSRSPSLREALPQEALPVGSPSFPKPSSESLLTMSFTS